MEHIKGLIESTVARESVALESGIILLAIAVSGAPFMGLLGTVWGVMEVFSAAAQEGNASLTTVAQVWRRPGHYGGRSDGGDPVYVRLQLAGA